MNDNEIVELISKLMAVIEPNRVNNILLSVVTAFLSCLVIVKDKHLTLIAQSIDIGKNLACQFKTFTEPIIIRVLSDQLDYKNPNLASKIPSKIQTLHKNTNGSNTSKNSSPTKDNNINNTETQSNQYESMDNHLTKD